MAAAMLALAICAASVFFAVNATQAGGTRAIEAGIAERDVQRHATAAIRDAADGETALRTYLFTKDAAYLDAFAAKRMLAVRELSALSRMMALEGELRPYYEVLELRASNMAAVMDRMIAFGRAGDFHAARAVDLAAQEAAAMSAMRDARTALQEAAYKRGSEIDQQVRKARARVNALMIVLWVLFVLTIVVAFVFMYGEQRQLQAVTARLRAANEALEIARVRAEEADAAKTRFLALASHDMRQPLHAITLYLAALGRRVDGGQAKEILVRTEMAAKSLTRMFSGLLDLARIESGVLKAKPTDFALQETFDAVAAALMEDAVRAKVDLRVVATSVKVHSDPELLASIVRNLVTNAIKYAPGGRVVIGARRVAGGARIEVHDEGPGIPPDKMIIVFGEFVRLDATKGAGVDGLGLGLAIAARIADLLASPLKVASKFGKGATFFLTAPIAIAAAAPQPPAGTVDARELHGILVALLDDDHLSRAAMTGALTDAGGEVQSFASAAGYVAAIRAGADFDLVISDPALLMEVGNAITDWTDRVRPPILLVSGATDAPALARFQASGLPYLIKPVKEATLLAEAARVARRPLVGAEPDAAQ
jgi:signal transduction histidine kinase/CheY-like chemotaxis protein